jgi:hypothetical protein
LSVARIQTPAIGNDTIYPQAFIVTRYHNTIFCQNDAVTRASEPDHRPSVHPPTPPPRFSFYEIVFYFFTEYPGIGYLVNNNFLYQNIFHNTILPQDMEDCCAVAA